MILVNRELATQVSMRRLLMWASVDWAIVSLLRLLMLILLLTQLLARRCRPVTVITPDEPVLVLLAVEVL